MNKRFATTLWLVGMLVAATLSLIAPTFTLAPSISAIDTELTRVFSDPSVYQRVVDQFATQMANAQLLNKTMEPDQIDQELEHLAYVNVGFDIIGREMEIDGVKGAVSGTGFKRDFRIFYEYTSTQTPLDITQRIPHMLCGLQSAGLVNQYVRISVEQNRVSKNPYQGHLFCISPATIQSLNCSAPGQINLEDILSDPVSRCVE